jgi:hypothetical protein
MHLKLQDPFVYSRQWGLVLMLQVAQPLCSNVKQTNTDTSQRPTIRRLQRVKEPTAEEGHMSSVPMSDPISKFSPCLKQ